MQTTFCNVCQLSQVISLYIQHHTWYTDCNTRIVTWHCVITQVPQLWNRSPEAAAAKLSDIASALGIQPAAAAALLMSQPTLASINMPGVVRDRVEAVSDAVGVSIAQVRMKQRQQH